MSELRDKKTRYQRKSTTGATWCPDHRCLSLTIKAYRESTFFWQRTVFVCKTILATILISSSESRIYGIGPTFVFIELTKISGGSVYMKIICDGP